MLDPKVYDVLAKAIREVARGFPNGNVCKVCALGLVCTTPVFLALIGAKYEGRPDDANWHAVFAAWLASHVACAWLCKGERNSASDPEGRARRTAKKGADAKS
jgi:hypothetical protein